MATQRIKIANNKRGTASTKHKREIAKLLEDGKAEKAIIRVEHVIRDDYTMEAYEIIELMCDLLYERARHLTKSELCPPDLVEAVSTVIWASSRVDIAELEGAKKQLGKKYGKEFVELCEENSRNTVNNRVMHKLNVAPPSNLLIRSYLQEIAKEYCVDWDDDSFPIKKDGTYKDGQQMGYSIPVAPSSGLGGVYMNQSIPTPMDTLPPGYNESLSHTTTEVGQGQQQSQQQVPGKYYEEEAPPQYLDAMKMLSTQQQQPMQHQPLQPPMQPPMQQPTQQLPIPPPPPTPQQQEQQPPPQQEQQPPPTDTTTTTSTTTNSDNGNTAPSYDDLMARFKNLKN
jgi:vacuolar protein sorting-associated protein IST1